MEVAHRRIRKVAALALCLLGANAVTDDDGSANDFSVVLSPPVNMSSDAVISAIIFRGYERWDGTSEGWMVTNDPPRAGRVNDSLLSAMVSSYGYDEDGSGSVANGRDQFAQYWMPSGTCTLSGNNCTLFKDDECGKDDECDVAAYGAREALVTGKWGPYAYFSIQAVWTDPNTGEVTQLSTVDAEWSDPAGNPYIEGAMSVFALNSSGDGAASAFAPRGSRGGGSDDGSFPPTPAPTNCTNSVTIVAGASDVVLWTRVGDDGVTGNLTVPAGAWSLADLAAWWSAATLTDSTGAPHALDCFFDARHYTFTFGVEGITGNWIMPGSANKGFWGAIGHVYDGTLSSSNPTTTALAGCAADDDDDRASNGTIALFRPDAETSARPDFDGAVNGGCVDT